MKRPMRIGIDAHVLGKNIGGVEPYVEQVVRLLPDVAPQHEYIVFLNRGAYARGMNDKRNHVRYVPLPASDPVLQRSLVLPWLIRRHRLDVIQVQRIAPWFSGSCRVLLTVHDLIPLKHPERYPGFRNQLIRRLTGGSVRNAAMVLTPTAAVARQITEHFPDVRVPIRPFYSGVDLRQFSAHPSGTEDDTLQRFGIRRPFLLTVGAIEARKNLEMLVQTLKLLGDYGSPSLVVVGSTRDAAYLEDVKAQAAEAGVADRIHWLGFVPHAQLADLYRAAAVFVTPSWDEGFNLAPLEALASGTPIVCSDIPAHRELYESCAELFPVDSLEHLTKAVTAILSGHGAHNPSSQSVAACVKRLSWEAMAQRMGGFIEELQ